MSRPRPRRPWGAVSWTQLLIWCCGWLGAGRPMEGWISFPSAARRRVAPGRWTARTGPRRGLFLASLSPQPNDDTTTTMTVTVSETDPLSASSFSIYPRLSTAQLRERLVQLAPRISSDPHPTDKDDHHHHHNNHNNYEQMLREMEMLIDTLEQRYQPIQTLDFFNLACQGAWQLLLSTNLFQPRLTHPRTAASSSSTTRLQKVRPIRQTLQGQGRNGTLTQEMDWVLSWPAPNDDRREPDATTTLEENEESRLVAEARGTLTVDCRYQLVQGGARMALQVQGRRLTLAPKSALPPNVPALMQQLHRTMPREMFDPDQHALDTTYLDDQMRIVRYTGPRLEGIRNVLIRPASSEMA